VAGPVPATPIILAFCFTRGRRDKPGDDARVRFNATKIRSRWKRDRSELLISCSESRCLLLFLRLWACGQRSCIVHHVHSPSGDRVTTPSHHTAMGVALPSA
jgi:hypothetical protein